MTIDSEIELPELVSDSERDPVAWILIGTVPDSLTKKSSSGILFEASKNDFLLKLAKIGRFRVQNGNTITIQPNKTAAPEEIRLFLLGSIMGALLHQRGVLPLHGSTVAKNNLSFIITGLSAAGKSTLAAGLISKGYSLIADDISVISQIDNERLSVHLGIPHLKLWRDVIDYFNDGDSMERVRSNIEKYKKPIITPISSEHIYLSKIIVLSTKNTIGFSNAEIFGSQKFSLLRENTYRIQYVNKMDQTSNHFESIAQLAKKTRLFKVERPSYPLEVRELAEFIESRVFDL